MVERFSSPKTIKQPVAASSKNYTGVVVSLYGEKLIAVMGMSSEELSPRREGLARPSIQVIGRRSTS